MYCDDPRDVTGRKPFHLQVISEEGDTQLSLKWVNLDEKRVEEDYCEG